MKKKWHNTVDKNDNKISKGDYVFFQRWRDDEIILGKILAIHDANVYVANVNNKHDVWELCPMDFVRATNNQIILWIFENS